MKKRSQPKKPIPTLGLVAVVSLVWLILRTGTKPSRIVYPCQKVAVANINIFLLALALPFNGLRRRLLPPHVLGGRVRIEVITAFLVLFVGVYALGMVTTPTPPVVNLNPLILNLQPQMALATTSTSNLFIVQNASGTQGNMDAAMSALIVLMQNHNLMFYKTTANPSGLIGNNDVIIIKVNGQSPQRGGTNTDLAKSLVKQIVGHPEGFTGEIVIADNGQSTGGIDMAENNAYDHSQSMADVAGMFPTYKVSAYSWYPIAAKSVNEYNRGDYQDGYVVNFTANAVTGLRVSYPKFKTVYRTYISFKLGVWNQTAGSYDSTRLKVINLPMFKSHYNYGATSCVKNYMGVGSQTLTAEHNTVGNGGMGTQMVKTRFPTLNIIDCIWINANPFQAGDACGPFTTYDIASYTNLIGASTDPVALEYWVAKHVAIPTAIQRGYTDTSSIDPDYAPVTPGLTQSYHNYLTNSMNVIKNSGRQVTMHEDEMNVYVVQPSPSSPVLFSDGFESGDFSAWSNTLQSTGETTNVTASTYYRGKYSAQFTSNGEGGVEFAACQVTVASPDLYCRGYFYVCQSGIVENNDHFFFITFNNADNGLAYAGWSRSGGIVKWILTTRDGTSYVDTYASSSPSLNRWYCVELHWRKGTTDGCAELFVNGASVCSVTGKNTSDGDVAQADFGLPEVSNCGATSAYADCAVLSTQYTGPEPPGILFSDGFESTTFNGWSIAFTRGETAATTTSRFHHGTRSATFYSNGGGGTERCYIYRTVTVSSELYVRSYIYVSQSGIVQVGDRVLMTSICAGSTAVAYGGWSKTTSGLRWLLSITSGTGTSTVYSTTAPLTGRWYCVELHWRKGTTDGLGDLWVNGAMVCSLTGRNASTYGGVNLVRIGLPEVYNCGATRVYTDCLAVSRYWVGPE